MDNHSTDNEIDCGVPNRCARKTPRWLVAIDNIPTIALFILGAAIIWFASWLLMVAYAVYCAISIVLFWRIICSYCHHFNTSACPCGYGSVAPRFFKSRLAKGTEFRSIFRRNITIMFPVWIVPLLVGIYLTIYQFTNIIFLTLILFCIDGFVIIPSISRLVGCRDCEIKDDCPWISGKKDGEVNKQR